jgi:hypothetical protein
VPSRAKNNTQLGNTFFITYMYLASHAIYSSQPSALKTFAKIYIFEKNIKFCNKYQILQKYQMFHNIKCLRKNYVFTMS